MNTIKSLTLLSQGHEIHKYVKAAKVNTKINYCVKLKNIKNYAYIFQAFPCIIKTLITAFIRLFFVNWFENFLLHFKWLNKGVRKYWYTLVSWYNQGALIDRWHAADEKERCSDACCMSFYRLLVTYRLHLSVPHFLVTVFASVGVLCFFLVVLFILLSVCLYRRWTFLPKLHLLLVGLCLCFVLHVYVYVYVYVLCFGF